MNTEEVESEDDDDFGLAFPRLAEVDDLFAPLQCGPPGEAEAGEACRTGEDSSLPPLPLSLSSLAIPPPLHRSPSDGVRMVSMCFAVMMMEQARERAKERGEERGGGGGGGEGENDEGGRKKSRTTSVSERNQGVRLGTPPVLDDDENDGEGEGDNEKVFAALV